MSRRFTIGLLFPTHTLSLLMSLVLVYLEHIHVVVGTLALQSIGHMFETCAGPMYIFMQEVNPLYAMQLKCQWYTKFTTHFNLILSMLLLHLMGYTYEICRH